MSARGNCRFAAATPDRRLPNSGRVAYVRMLRMFCQRCPVHLVTSISRRLAAFRDSGLASWSPASSLFHPAAISEETFPLIPSPVKLIATLLQVLLLTLYALGCCSLAWALLSGLGDAAGAGLVQRLLVVLLVSLGVTTVGLVVLLAMRATQDQQSSELDQIDELET
jgi:hypothetical protein